MSRIIELDCRFRAEMYDLSKAIASGGEFYVGSSQGRVFHPYKFGILSEITTFALQTVPSRYCRRD